MKRKHPGIDEIEKLRKLKPLKEIEGVHKGTGLKTFTYEGKGSPVFLLLKKTETSRTFIELKRFEAMSKKEQDALIAQHR